MVNIKYTTNFSFEKDVIGKETNFHYKLWSALFKCVIKVNMVEFLDKGKEFTSNFTKDVMKFQPKITTFRKDEAHEYEKGTEIISLLEIEPGVEMNFLPKIECVSTQMCEIKYPEQISPGQKTLEILISAKYYGAIFLKNGEITVSSPKIKNLITNDGFDNAADFMNFFSKPWKGKIIHFTNLRY